MSNEYILSHDLGTTGLKSCIYNSDGVLIGSKYKPYKTYYPKLNFVEQEPEEWWQNICFCTKELIKELQINISEIEWVCLSGHMNGVVLVDEKGNLLRKRTFLWADSRSKKQSDYIEDLIGYENFFKITGGGLDTVIYPAAKLLWIKENEPEIFKQIYKVLGTKDYILLKLTGRFVTDFSEASNSGLMDIKKRVWSSEILDTLAIKKDILPDVYHFFELAGDVSKEASQNTSLKQGTKVVIGGGDVVCASVGAGAVELDNSYLNIGSASWVSKNFKEPLLDLKSRPFNLCHIVKDLYASQVVMYGGGICYQWITDIVGEMEKYFADLIGVSVYDLIETKLRNIKENTDNLIFLPFLRGGGAPYFNMDARGLFIGLSLSHKKEDIIRSVLEGTALNMRSLFSFLESGEKEKSEIKIIGGALSNNWCQIIADICNRNVLRPVNLQESTSFGAAITGCVGVGIFNDFSVVNSLLQINDIFYPNQKKSEKYEKLYSIFLEVNQSANELFKRIAVLNN